MKLLIIIAIAFILLIPLTSFAQESFELNSSSNSLNPSEYKITDGYSSIQISTGKIGELGVKDVSIMVLAPNGNIISKDQKSVEENEKFSTKRILDEIIHSLVTYTINAEYGNEKFADTVSFEFIESSQSTNKEISLYLQGFSENGNMKFSGKVLQIHPGHMVAIQVISQDNSLLHIEQIALQENNFSFEIPNGNMKKIENYIVKATYGLNSVSYETMPEVKVNQEIQLVLEKILTQDSDSEFQSFLLLIIVIVIIISVVIIISIVILLIRSKIEVANYIKKMTDKKNTKELNFQKMTHIQDSENVSDTLNELGRKIKQDTKTRSTQDEKKYDKGAISNIKQNEKKYDKRVINNIKQNEKKYDKGAISNIKQNEKKLNFQKMTHIQDSENVSDTLNELRRKIKQDTKTRSTQDEKKYHRGIYDNIEQSSIAPKQDLGKLNSEEERILTSTDSYKILGVSTDSNFTEIKKQWKTLNVKYNATRGALTRSIKEQKKRTEIQIKINKAWEDIRGKQK